MYPPSEIGDDYKEYGKVVGVIRGDIECIVKTIIIIFNYYTRNFPVKLFFFLISFLVFISTENTVRRKSKRKKEKECKQIFTLPNFMFHHSRDWNDNASEWIICRNKFCGWINLLNFQGIFP